MCQFPAIAVEMCQFPAIAVEMCQFPALAVEMCQFTAIAVTVQTRRFDDTNLSRLWTIFLARLGFF